MKIAQFFRWFFGLKPKTVEQSLPQTIENNSVVKSALYHFPHLTEDQCVELGQIQSAMSEHSCLLVNSALANPNPDYIAALAIWLTENIHGVHVAISSVNLQQSYAIRAKIDQMVGVEKRKRQISNKLEIIFADNESKITIVTHERCRGYKIDVLLLNGVDNFTEYNLSQFMIVNSVIAKGGSGKVLAFYNDVKKLKGTYFSGFFRLSF